MAGEGLCLFFFLCDGRNVWHFKFTYKRPSVNATHFYYYNPVNSRNKHVSQLHPPRRWGNTALSHLSIGEVVLIQFYLRIKNRQKGENITKMSHNGSLQQHVRLRKIFAWRMVELFADSWHICTMDYFVLFYLHMQTFDLYLALTGGVTFPFY